MPFVLAPDSTTGTYSSGAYVPTLGSKGQAIDLYRCADYQSDGWERGLSFTDVMSASALAKLIEGPITKYEELLAAETALQALLLTENPQIYVPSVKMFDAKRNYESYMRADYGLRSELAFRLFDYPDSWDFLAASGIVHANEGLIVSASDSHSRMVGKGVDKIKFQDLNNGKISENTALVLAMTVGVPGYFSDGQTIRANRGDGFQKRFYSTLNESWKSAVSGIPPVICSFTLPPLLAIVLDRASSRQNIPEEITDLRAELACVRGELLDLNDLVCGAAGQAEIERRVARIDQSFAGMMPESRLMSSERIQRTITKVQSLARPLIKLASGFFLNNGGDLNDTLSNGHDFVTASTRTEKLVDRTITAQEFWKYLKTDSVQSLVQHHFSTSEILWIERSLS